MRGRSPGSGARVETPLATERLVPAYHCKASKATTLPSHCMHEDGVGLASSGAATIGERE